MALDLTKLIERPRGSALDLGTPTATQKKVLDHFRDGKRIVLMVAGRQSGKQLCLDTEVPTPDGWKLLRDIKPGDYVFAPDGSPTEVLWESEIDDTPETYRLTLDDGTEILADADHEWVSYTKSVRKSLGRAQNPMGPVTLTTKEMAETQVYGGGDDWVNPKTGRRREANHALKVPEPVFFPKADLPVHPYLLGLWLGDGARDTGQVTSGDAEIWDSIEGLGYELGTPQLREDSKGVTITVLGLQAALRELGVLGRKRIPDAYFEASAPQRRELLRGLMDSDGSVTRDSGSLEYYSSDLELITDVRELLAGLGIKTRLRSKEARAYGKNYGLAYTLAFAADWPVFHLERKKRLQRLSGRMERNMRYVHAIERTDPVPMKCIAVAHPSSQFLITRNYVPTHNSHLGARWLILQTMNPHAKDKLAFAIAPTYQMARVIERKIQEVLKLDPALWKQVEYRAGPPPTYTFPNGWVIEVRSADNPDSLRGPTISAVWFDEVAAADEYAFDVIMPTLLANDGAFLGTTTPRGVTNWIYDRIFLKTIAPGKAGHDPVAYNEGYAAVTGSTWENVDNLNPEAIKMLEDQYGKDSAFGRQEIAGEFVSYEGLVYRWDAHNSVSSMDMPQLHEYSQIIGGIDFGWTDPAAAYVLGYKEGVWYVIDGIYGSHIEPNDFAEQLATLTSNYRVSRWYADSARPELIADLNSRGLPVLGVKKPRVEDRIREMAMFADNNRLKISTMCPDVIREITSYKWPERPRRDSTGAVKPLDENDHSLDAIGYAIYSVRWLWRNDVEIADRVRESRRKDVDIDDIQFQEWKRRNVYGRRSRAYGPAGRAGM